VAQLERELDLQRMRVAVIELPRLRFTWLAYITSLLAVSAGTLMFCGHWVTGAAVQMCSTAAMLADLAWSRHRTRTTGPR
jgi:hypothetical protein